MRHDVVGRIEPLARVRVRDQGDRAVVLVAHHTPREMLAGELPALKVERVAVAVVRRHAEHRHAPIVLEPAHLPVVGDVAPDEVAALAAPRRTLGPERPRPEPLDRRVDLAEAVERRVDREDVGVHEIDVRRCVRTEVARRRGDHARRLGGLGLGAHGAGRQRDDAGGGAGGDEITS